MPTDINSFCSLCFCYQGQSWPQQNLILAICFIFTYMFIFIYNKNDYDWWSTFNLSNSTKDVLSLAQLGPFFPLKYFNSYSDQLGKVSKKDSGYIH